MAKYRKILQPPGHTGDDKQPVQAMCILKMTAQLVMIDDPYHLITFATMKP